MDKIPNATNLVPDLVNPAWDPTGEYSMPWQSGMTGVAYNTAVTGRELTSINDLFDPEFKGKIGMLTEMRDTVGLMMLATGEDPATATFDSAQPAFEKIEQAKARRPDPSVHRQRLHGRPGVGELRRVHRVVRRHRAARPRQPRPRVRRSPKRVACAGRTPW